MTRWRQGKATKGDAGRIWPVTALLQWRLQPTGLHLGFKGRLEKPMCRKTSRETADLGRHF